MKRRVILAGVAAITGLLVPLAAAAPPADAGTGVGCVGADCSVSVFQFVTLTPPGNVGASGNSVVPINVPPPPCLWDPIGDATTGSQFIISNFGSTTRQGSAFGVFQSVQQAKHLLARPEAGTWYELPDNPAAGAQGMAECARLPLFAFEPPGVAPPAPNVPPVDLAEYAYNHMVIPKPTVQLMPGARGFVNLATYVHLTTPGEVRVQATLRGAGGETVFVRARPIRTAITSSAGGRVYADCGLTGSKFQPGHLPAPGAGVPPDCGVLWQAPTTEGTVTATVTWRVTWGGAGGGGVLPQVALTGTSLPIRVAEIQSINGTGNDN